MTTTFRIGKLGAVLACFVAYAISARAQQQLVGTWSCSIKNMPEMTLDLRADGSGTLLGESFRWTSTATDLRVTTEEGTDTYGYEFKDGNLVLSGGELPMPLSFSRKDTRSALSEPDASAPDRQGTVPKPDGGGVAMELVGKWCYMANVNANDGGRMTNECVTFRSDGTFEYYRETSSSGSYGSSASQESDAGTWMLRGGVLQVQSYTKGALQYTLQKMNHPKNVNDPMLVIDGRAFVTYEQRAPW